MAALTTRTCRSWMSRMTGVRAWVRPTPMWCSRPLTRRVTTPPLSILSWRMRSWVSWVRSAARVGFGQRGVDGGWGRSVRQRAVRTVLVVDLHELIEQRLQFGDRGGWDGLGVQPVLQRLLEAFDFPAGGGVVGAGVLLDDVEAA